MLLKITWWIEVEQGKSKSCVSYLKVRSRFGGSSQSTCTMTFSTNLPGFRVESRLQFQFLIWQTFISLNSKFTWQTKFLAMKSFEFLLFWFHWVWFELLLTGNTLTKFAAAWLQFTVKLTRINETRVSCWLWGGAEQTKSVEVSDYRFYSKTRQTCSFAIKSRARTFSNANR